MHSGPLIMFLLLNMKLFHCDNLDFNKHLLGKFAHSDSRAGGEGRSEVLGIYSVHRCEIVHVGQENGSFNYIVDSQASLGENSLDIGDRLCGLSGDAFSHSARLGVYGNLT